MSRSTSMGQDRSPPPEMPEQVPESSHPFEILSSHDMLVLSINDFDDLALSFANSVGVEADNHMHDIQELLAPLGSSKSANQLRQCANDEDHGSGDFRTLKRSVRNCFLQLLLVCSNSVNLIFNESRSPRPQPLLCLQIKSFDQQPPPLESTSRLHQMVMENLAKSTARRGAMRRSCRAPSVSPLLPSPL